MRVTFVSSHAAEGGSERYLEALLGGLGPSWVGSVVTLQNGPLVERLRAAAMQPLVIDTGRGAWAILSSARRLRVHVRLTDVAVVHANGVKAALVAVVAGVPTVWVKHDDSFDGPIGRWIARRCRAVVGVSAATLAGIGSPPTARVVHTGIAVPPVDRGATRDLVDDLVGGRRPVVSLIGRLDPVKGHGDLLRAAPPGAVVLFVGPDDPHCSSYAAELRASAGPNVIFAGGRSDAREIAAGSDVVAVPSRNEGFGLVAAEALAVGTPVVGYAVGALPEVVGECGVLVAPGDVSALAAALERVLEDVGTRDALAACGTRRIAELFSVERWLDDMRSTYATAARP